MFRTTFLRNNNKPVTEVQSQGQSKAAYLRTRMTDYGSTNCYSVFET